MRLFWIASAFLILHASAFAEEFTLTRQDGRVFTCSDGGTPPPAAASVRVCECVTEYRDLGQVVGENAAADCASLSRAYSERGILRDCASARGPAQALICQCQTEYRSLGQVIGPDAGAQCTQLAKAYSERGRLSECKL